MMMRWRFRLHTGFAKIDVSFGGGKFGIDERRFLSLSSSHSSLYL